MFLLLTSCWSQNSLVAVACHKSFISDDVMIPYGHMSIRWCPVISCACDSGYRVVFYKQLNLYIKYVKYISIYLIYSMSKFKCSLTQLFIISNVISLIWLKCFFDLFVWLNQWFMNMQMVLSEPWFHGPMTMVLLILGTQFWTEQLNWLWVNASMNCPFNAFALIYFFPISKYLINHRATICYYAICHYKKLWSLRTTYAR